MGSKRLLAAAALLAALPAAGCVAPYSNSYHDDGYYRTSSYSSDRYNDGAYYDGYWGYYKRDGYYRRGNYYYNSAYPNYAFGNGGYWYGGRWYARPVVVVRYNNHKTYNHPPRHDRDDWRGDDRDDDRDRGHHRDGDRNWSRDRDGDRDHRRARESDRGDDSSSGRDQYRMTPRGPRYQNQGSENREPRAFQPRGERNDEGNRPARESYRAPDPQPAAMIAPQAVPLPQPEASPPEAPRENRNESFSGRPDENQQQ